MNWLFAMILSVACHCSLEYQLDESVENFIEESLLEFSKSLETELEENEDKKMDNAGLRRVAGLSKPRRRDEEKVNRAKVREKQAAANIHRAEEFGIGKLLLPSNLQELVSKSDVQRQLSKRQREMLRYKVKQTGESRRAQSKMEQQYMTFREENKRDRLEKKDTNEDTNKDKNKDKDAGKTLEDLEKTTKVSKGDNEYKYEKPARFAKSRDGNLRDYHKNKDKDAGKTLEELEKTTKVSKGDNEYKYEKPARFAKPRDGNLRDYHIVDN